MSYWLFLDDERYPPKHWGKSLIICRNYFEFMKTLSFYGVPEFISFDHDLGEGATGYDCAVYLVDWLMDHDRNDFIDFTIHSANPVGAANIEHLLNNWNNKGRVS